MDNYSTSNCIYVKLQYSMTQTKSVLFNYRTKEMTICWIIFSSFFYFSFQSCPKVLHWYITQLTFSTCTCFKLVRGTCRPVHLKQQTVFKSNSFCTVKDNSHENNFACLVSHRNSIQKVLPACENQLPSCQKQTWEPVLKTFHLLKKKKKRKCKL